MATFQAQVQSLTSLTISTSGTTPTEAELTDFLTQGAKEVINRITAANPETKMQFAATTEDDNNEGTAINGDIISVVREHDSTSILRPCVKINAEDRSLSTDTESLKYKSKYNPGWYELNGKIFVVPVSAGSDNSSLVTQIAYPTVPFGDTNWSYPAKYETLIAYYGAMMSLLAKAGSLHTDSSLTSSIDLINSSVDSAISQIELADSSIDKLIFEVEEAIQNLSDSETHMTNALTELQLMNPEIDNALSVITNLKVDIDISRSRLEESKAELNNNTSLLSTTSTLVGNSSTWLSSGDGNKLDGIYNLISGSLGEIEAKGFPVKAGAAFDKAKKLFSDDAGFNALSDVTDDLTNSTSVTGWLEEEDPEMVTSTINAIATEMKRGESEINKWVAECKTVIERNSLNKSKQDNVALNFKLKTDDAVNYANLIKAYSEQAANLGRNSEGYLNTSKAYLQAVESYVNVARGYGEVNDKYLKLSDQYQKNAGQHLNIAQAYTTSGQGYLGTGEGYLKSADNYSKEASVRMQYLQQEYSWYTSRYSQIKSKYDEAFFNEEQITKRNQAIKEALSSARRKK